jgi:hypothetical protein
MMQPVTRKQNQERLALSLAMEPLAHRVHGV